MQGNGKQIFFFLIHFIFPPLPFLSNVQALLHTAGPVDLLYVLRNMLYDHELITTTHAFVSVGEVTL